MKPKNFPARKLRRQIRAEYRRTDIAHPNVREVMLQARSIRTKKRRANV